MNYFDVLHIFPCVVTQMLFEGAITLLLLASRCVHTRAKLAASHSLWNMYRALLKVLHELVRRSRYISMCCYPNAIRRRNHTTSTRVKLRSHARQTCCQPFPMEHVSGPPKSSTRISSTF